jgi:hypothetical protein
MSERRAPLSAAGYQRMVARAGVVAKFTFLVHTHMLTMWLTISACLRGAGANYRAKRLISVMSGRCLHLLAVIRIMPRRLSADVSL